MWTIDDRRSAAAEIHVRRSQGPLFHRLPVAHVSCVRSLPDSMFALRSVLLSYSVSRSQRLCSHMPVITVPKYLEAELKRNEVRNAEDIELLMEERQRRGNRRIPIIRCKHNARLNMYYGQTYPKTKKRRQDNIPLASAGWMRGEKYRNDEIVFTSYERNPIYKKANPQREPKEQFFDQLSLHPLMIQILESIGLQKPSLIQSRAIPRILSGANCTVSAETGSGKTIAYAAPLIQLVAKEKEKDPFANQMLRYNDRKQPRAIILVPGRELAEQVANLTEKLASPFGVGVAAMIGGVPREVQHSGYDIIITTLGLMKKHLGRAYSHHKLQHLVLDEADTLLDDSNNFDVLEIIERLQFKTTNDFHGIQMILVSATVPQEMERILGECIDMSSFQIATTPMLHQVPRHITQTFIRVNRFDREAALLRLVHGYMEKGEPTIIFSDRTPMSNYVCAFLRENGIDCLRLNKSLGEYERLENFRRFQSGDCDFMSCTNLASRGLDTTRVKNIINYECPRFIADYIHRIGRVGRLGSRGGAHVTNFVSFKPAVSLLQQLELAVRTGRPLDGMDANIKRLLRGRHQNEDEPRFSAVQSPAD